MKIHSVKLLWDLWKDYTKRSKMVNVLSANELFEDQELEFKRKDGTILNGLLSTSLIDLKGVPHAITVTKEITRRVEAEKELRQKNEELLIANSEKDKLFSIVSHDLKNAFNIFLGYTDLLATDIDNLNRDETNSMAKSMNKSAKNLYKLLENLLEWSVFKRGLKSINKENIFLYKLTDEITEQIIGTAAEKNISIEKNIPHNISIMADRQMLEIIIRNLISNALKFTHRGGLVSISANKIDDNGVSISVSDTGIGMNEEFSKNLFNPGIDSKRKGTDNEQSSGLGLVLVKEYTAKLGGTISVASEEGKGSRFTLTLPADSNS
ncbi:MAG: HAMP domain-containing histidine kinase [Bacteroidetes bacterium]|nr:HAMP domain-containing histidine kinase [Bacteroidota bacterium]